MCTQHSERHRLLILGMIYGPKPYPSFKHPVVESLRGRGSGVFKEFSKIFAIRKIPDINARGGGLDLSTSIPYDALAFRALKHRSNLWHGLQGHRLVTSSTVCVNGETNIFVAIQHPATPSALGQPERQQVIWTNHLFIDFVKMVPHTSMSLLDH